MQGLRRVRVEDKFRILSLNHDINGIEFISSLEHITYPFYGLQFHPEKNLYEWKLGRKIPHGKNAIEIAQYFANFFVNEGTSVFFEGFYILYLKSIRTKIILCAARKNHHKFESSEEEAATLIYNYSPTYTALSGSDFMQSYIFNLEDTF